MVALDFKRVIQRFIDRSIARRRWRPSKLAGVVPPPPRLPATHQDAMQSLVEPLAFGSRAFRSKPPPDPDGVDPVFWEFLIAFQRELHRRNLPFIVQEVVRDRERQNALQKAGVSKARWGQSPHNFGMGADLIHYAKGWNITPKQWAVVGLVGKEVARKRQISVSWGGDWSFYDPAHWELSDWKQRKEIPLALRLDSYAMKGLDGQNVKKPLKPRV
jgi:hypothetical protein